MERRGVFIRAARSPELIKEACRSVEIKHNRPCLSAVSKILWMMHRGPHRDVRQQGAQKTEENMQKVAYSGTTSIMHVGFEEFGRVSDKIRKAQAWLPNGTISRRLERYGAATGRELRSWIGQPWFANRIFDQWFVGVTE